MIRDPSSLPRIGPRFRTCTSILALSALLAGVAGCGGGDSTSDTVSASDIQSCLQDSGLNAEVSDPESLPPRETDAGVIDMVAYWEGDGGQTSWVRVFETPEKASAWADDQQGVYHTAVEAYGPVAIVTGPDDPRRADLTGCAGG